MSSAKGTKGIIFYARDYRHFSSSKRGTLLFLLTAVLPVTLCFIVFYSSLTSSISVWASKIISDIAQRPASVSSVSFIPWFGPVYFVQVDGTTPGFTHTLVALLVTIAAIPIVSQSGANFRSLSIYICMGLYVQLISCVFFLFWPSRFPYTLSQYSQLYMVQSAALWIIIPMLLGIALSLMQAGFVSRLVVLLSEVLILLLYDIIRYVVYLSLLIFCSSLYMASLFFSFGVLFDFIQMVMVYSFFAKLISERYDTLAGRSQWAWS